MCPLRTFRFRMTGRSPRIEYRIYVVLNYFDVFGAHLFSAFSVDRDLDGEVHVRVLARDQAEES